MSKCHNECFRIQNLHFLFHLYPISLVDTHVQMHYLFYLLYVVYDSIYNNKILQPIKTPTITIQIIENFGNLNINFTKNYVKFLTSLLHQC